MDGAENIFIDRQCGEGKRTIEDRKRYIVSKFAVQLLFDSIRHVLIYVDMYDIYTPNFRIRSSYSGSGKGVGPL